MITFINVVVWYSIFKMVEYSATVKNPYLLLLPILLSYFIIVVEGVFKTKTSRE